MSHTAICLYDYSRDLGDEPLSNDGAVCGLPATHHAIGYRNELTGDGVTREPVTVMACAGHAAQLDWVFMTHELADECFSKVFVWSLTRNRCEPERR